VSASLPQRLAIALSVVVFAAAHVSHLGTLGEVHLYPDSKTYLKVAAHPVFSREIWLGEVPAPPPLLFKAARRTPETIAAVQVWLFVVAWATLALVVASAVAPGWRALLVCLVVLAIGSSPNVMAWNHLVLSESLSISLLVLAVASWIKLLERWSALRATAACTFGVLYGLARDLNAWTVALAGIVILAALASRLRSPVAADADPIRSRRTPLAVIGCVHVAVLVAGTYSASVGERRLPAIYSNVAQRVLTDPERLEEFRRAGMPVDDALMRRKGKWAWSDDAAFFEDPALADFRAWAREHGVATFAVSLLRHPLRGAWEAALALPLVARPQFPEFKRHGFIPILPGVVARVAGSKAMTLLYGLATVALAADCLLRRRWSSSPLLPVALVLLAVVVPTIALAWHGSPMEIVRHAFQAIVIWRVALVLLVAAYAGGRAARNAVAGV
jgi:hypothetical protein